MRYSMGLAALLTIMGCGSNEPTLQGTGRSGSTAETTAHAAGSEGEALEAGRCDRSGDHSTHGHGAEGHAAAPTGPRPVRVLEDGTQLFGAELTGHEETALSAIAADPQAFDGQVVRTSGTVERVCQRMGCWMELRAEGSPSVRVPMAGHAFFLPRDAQGRTATIEGTVTVRELDPGQRTHLESEGAQATASSLSIHATGVLVRPAS